MRTRYKFLNQGSKLVELSPNDTHDAHMVSVTLLSTNDPEEEDILEITLRLHDDG